MYVSTVLTAVLTALLCLGRAAALNFTLQLTGDTRRVVDLGTFGYAAGGVLAFTVESAALALPPGFRGPAAPAAPAGAAGAVVIPAGGTAPPPPVGLMLVQVQSLSVARQLKKYTGHCFPVSSEAAVTATAAQDVLIPLPPELWTPPPGVAVGPLRPVSIVIRNLGLYALFYYNCLGAGPGGGPNARVNRTSPPDGGGAVGDATPPTSTASAGVVLTTLRISVSQYNAAGTVSAPYEKVSYLSVGSAHAATMNLFFGAIFALLAVVWIRELSSPPPRASVHPIHHAMTVLILVKVLELWSEALVQHHRERTGALNYGADYVYYLLSTLKGVMLFTVILLLGTGWSVLKPFLADRDRIILVTLLPLQIASHIAQAVTEESSVGSSSWATWHFALRLFDVACCCAVLIPVVVSIKTLNNTSSGDHRGKRSVVRLRQFRGFYVAVILFVYFTRIVFPFMEDTSSVTSSWIPDFMYESVALFFYSFVGILFRPGAEQESIREIVENADEIVIGTDEDEEEITPPPAAAGAGESKDRRSINAGRKKRRELPPLFPPASKAGEDDDVVLGEEIIVPDNTTDRLRR